MDADITTKARAGGRIKTIDQLLDECAIDTDLWDVGKVLLNKWDVAAKDVDGNMEVTEMIKLKVSLIPALKSKIVPASGAISRPPCGRPAVGPTETAVFLPDMQIGYKWNPDYTYLDPFQDRQAIDVALQIVRDTQPDHLVVLGDFLDLPQCSLKYRHHKDHAYRNTLQAAIEEGFYTLNRIREAAPNAQLHFLMGNHEERLARLLLEMLSELLDVRPAQAEKPVLDIPNLLRLSELGYRYNTGYDELMWIWERLCIRHGEEHGSKMNAGKLAFPTVQGHAHKMVYSTKTVDTPRGKELITLMSPGCLCRIDGAVPAATKNVDWQQGIGFATLIKETGAIHMQPVSITNGYAYHGDRVYKARSTDILEDEAASSTGIRALRRT